MMKTVLSAFIVFSGSFIACNKETLTNEEVVATIQRFDDGWLKKDSSKVDAVLSPSYTYFTQSGSSFNRSSILQTASSSEYQLQTAERKIISIKIEGNTAIVNTIWTGIGSYFGKAFDDRQRCSLTIIKSKGKTTILSEHCTLVK